MLSPLMKKVMPGSPPVYSKDWTVKPLLTSAVTSSGRFEGADTDGLILGVPGEPGVFGELAGSVGTGAVSFPAAQEVRNNTTNIIPIVCFMH